MTTEEKLYNALMVLLNDGAVVAHLTAWDNMAFKQALEAVIEYEHKMLDENQSIEIDDISHINE